MVKADIQVESGNVPDAPLPDDSGMVRLRVNINHECAEILDD